MSYVVRFIPKIGEGKMGLKNFSLKQPMNGYYLEVAFKEFLSTESTLYIKFRKIYNSYALKTKLLLNPTIL